MNCAILLRLSALSLVLAACQTARMPVPDDLAASERWIVQGRQGWKLNEAIRFGPYETLDVQRSWTRGRGIDVPGYAEAERTQSYSFGFRDAGTDAWLVKCATFLETGTVHAPVVDVELRNRSRLDCALSEAHGSETWILSLRESREHPLEGTLSTSTASYAVLGTSALAKSLPTAATSGYHVTSGGRTVAAVEVINAGSVTLHSSLDPRTKSLLSAAAAILLLLEDLRQTLDA